MVGPKPTCSRTCRHVRSAASRLVFAVSKAQNTLDAGLSTQLGLVVMAELSGDDRGFVPNGPQPGARARSNPTVRERADGAREGMDYTPPGRTQAIRDAGRHTARVRLLRRIIILGAVFGVSLIAIVAAFDPFRHLPQAVSLAGVGVAGTKITMDHPKISGVQEGGGPYEITATAGLQDILKPTAIELVGVDAKVGMADRTTTHILSSNGVYDSKADSMALTGNVKIANTSGYTLSMKSAVMDFKSGVFTSHERLRVDLKGGDVSADDMAISNNGHVIAFRGNIVSTFDPPEDDEVRSSDATSSTPALSEPLR